MKEIIEDIVTQLTALASRPRPMNMEEWHDFRNEFMALVHRLEFLVLSDGEE